jgi:hypothetical protein
MGERPPRFHRRPKDPGDGDGLDASAASTLAFDDKVLNEKTQQRKNELSPTEQQQQQQWHQRATTTSSTAQQQWNNNREYTTRHCSSHSSDSDYHGDSNLDNNDYNDDGDYEIDYDDAYNECNGYSDEYEEYCAYGDYERYDGGDYIVIEDPWSLDLPLLPMPPAQPVPPTLPVPPKPLPPTTLPLTKPPVATLPLTTPPLSTPPLTAQTLTTPLPTSAPPTEHRSSGLRRKQRKRARHRPLQPQLLPPLMEFEETIHAAIIVQSLWRGSLTRAIVSLPLPSARQPSPPQSIPLQPIPPQLCLLTEPSMECIEKRAARKVLKAQLKQNKKTKRERLLYWNSLSLPPYQLDSQPPPLPPIPSMPKQPPMPSPLLSGPRRKGAERKPEHLQQCKEKLARRTPPTVLPILPQPILPPGTLTMPSADFIDKCAIRKVLRAHVKQRKKEMREQLQYWMSLPSPPYQMHSWKKANLATASIPVSQAPPVSSVSPPPTMDKPSIPPPTKSKPSTMLLPRLPPKVHTTPQERLPSLTLLAYCDDFMVQYPPHCDEHEMARLVRMTRIDVSKQRIEWNSKIDKTDEGTSQGGNSKDIIKDKTNKSYHKDSNNKDSNNKDSDNKASVNQEKRKKNGSRDYYKVYRYQFGHCMMSKKRARCRSSKRKTRDGKFLKGPAKDDDTYISGNSDSISTDQLGSMGQRTRKVRKAPRKTQAAKRKRKRKCSRRGRKARTVRTSNQVLSTREVGWKGSRLQQVPWTMVQVTFQNGIRVWDAERTAREGGGGPARVAKFRDRSTQQLGSAADSAPVV